MTNLWYLITSYDEVLYNFKTAIQSWMWWITLSQDEFDELQKGPKWLCRSYGWKSEHYFNFWVIVNMDWTE